MRRLGLSLLAVLAGWLFAHPFHISAIAHASWYTQGAALLLAVGLFASTHSISLPEAREHWRLVLVAVTLGVVVKAALVAGVLLLCFRRPEYIVLAIAVAQIDPLSVATQAAGKRISPSARTILYAWASFDDPVTVLLTVYLSALALGGGTVPVGPGSAGSASVGPGAAGSQLGDFAGSLLPNAGVAAVAALWAWRRHKAWRTGSTTRTGDAADLAFLVVMLAGGAHYGLLPGVAVAGLYLRPAAVGSLDRVTRAAFYLAAALLGIVLVHGVAPGVGAVLGVAAFLAQVLVGSLVAYRLPWRDRRYLMLAQQNGITAIVLALILEPDFPGTVGIIAPAVLVINLLHAATNTWFEDGPAALLPPRVRHALRAPRAGKSVPARPAPVPAYAVTAPTQPQASFAAPARRARPGSPADRSPG